MTSSTHWLAELPGNRLIAEFSMWSADLINLASDLTRIAAHADVLHIDVADGHFAPALLFFPDLVAAIKKATAVPIHIHLMVADQVLLSQTRQFVEAGADLVSVHVENGAAIGPVFDYLDSVSVKKGMVLKVDTPVDEALPHIPRLDVLTLLGTAIGVKGQGLNEQAGARLQQAKALLAAHARGRRIVLAADGGIRDNTVPLLRAHGAETVVLGSLAFAAPDLGQRMAWLKAL
jgi:ribulose-phosphate 3-epimerase